MFRILRRLVRKKPNQVVFHWAGRDWTWKAIAEGFFVTGGIGSGKSFSTESLLKNLIRQGCGGIVACVKIDEIDRYTRIMSELGCPERLVRITPETHAIDVMAELERFSFDRDG